MEQINPDADAPWYDFDYEAHVYEPNESVVHIKNLRIVNVTVSGSRHVGGLVGRCFGGIENCQIEGGTLLVYPEPHAQPVVGRRDSAIMTVGVQPGCIVIGGLWGQWPGIL